MKAVDGLDFTAVEGVAPTKIAELAPVTADWLVIGGLGSPRSALDRGTVVARPVLGGLTASIIEKWNSTLQKLK